MNITEMIINAVLKKGLIYEAKNPNITFEVPLNNEMVKIVFTADNMTLKLDKSSTTQIKE